VKAMWLILQQPQAEDYIIATGETRSVRNMLDIALSRGGLDWEERVEVDPKLLRPAEVDYLCGNATKARERLGWAPQVLAEGTRVTFWPETLIVFHRDVRGQSHDLGVMEEQLA